MIDALVDEEKQELAEAVDAGRLTQAQADERLTELRARITDKVNGVRPEFRGGRHFGGPEPEGPTL